MGISKSVPKSSIIYTFPHAGNKQKRRTPLTRNVREAKEIQRPHYQQAPLLLLHARLQFNPIHFNPKSARVAPKRERMPDTG
jgi:hypothetical protein